MNTTYELRPNEGATALVAGVLTGAGVTAIPFVLMGPVIVAAFLLALVPWALGVFVLGPPAWWVVHRYTDRGPGWFLLAGSGVTFAGTLGLTTAMMGLRPDSVAVGVSFGMIMGMIGCLAGLAIWKVGYRTATTDPEMFQ